MGPIREPGYHGPCRRSSRELRSGRAGEIGRVLGEEVARRGAVPNRAAVELRDDVATGLEAALLLNREGRRQTW